MTRMEDRIHAHMTGENIDKPVIIPKPAIIHKLVESNRDLQFREVQKSPEARICALYQVNPAVIPVLVGLEHITFSANMDAARKSSYEAAILPRQRAFTNAIRRDVLDELGLDRKIYRPAYDRSEIGFLQDSQLDRIDKANNLYNSTLVKRNQALEYAGLNPVPNEEDQYKQTIASTEGDGDDGDESEGGEDQK